MKLMEGKKQIVVLEDMEEEEALLANVQMIEMATDLVGDKHMQNIKSPDEESKETTVEYFFNLPRISNVNFEMGTINSKRELWQKNPKKTSKTVLKTKSVDAGITPFFFLGKFSTCFKNGGENQFFA